MEDKKIIRNYAYMGPGDGNKEYHITEGQWISGYTVGIMHLDVYYPLMPGNVVNAYTYDFPVRHIWVPGANQARMHTGDETLLPDLIKTAKQLELEGCRAICGACGYFGHFQKRVADAIDIPVYLSSVVQVPWILTGLKSNQKVGILCGDAPNLTFDLFKSCGCTEEEYQRCAIAGAQDGYQFQALTDKRGYFENDKLRDELIKLAKDLVAKNPDIGAILLECSDMPPYAAAIQAELNLPVYDFITLIKYVHSTVAQRPYYGFI